MSWPADEHLVPIPDTSWKAWRWVWLRGSGFPGASLIELTAPRTAKLLDSGATSDLDTTFAAELRQNREALRRLVADPLMRLSLIWQNRKNAVENGVDRLLASPIDQPNSKSRLRERMIASYLQRRCAKNDTIGFFGPIGWASLDPSVAGFSIEPGNELVAAREVLFESWAMSTLARHLSEDEALRPWIPPVLSPVVRVEGLTLHSPLGDVPLDAKQAWLLARCTGEHTAKALAAAAQRDLGISSVDEVYALLAQAVAMKAVRWEISLPTTLHAEKDLAAVINRIDDDALREKAFAPLAKLESCRAAVAAASAAAMPDALGIALSDLDATFTELLQQLPTRSSGLAYAGRTLVYEDCRRDGHVTVGSGALEHVGPSLGLVLDVARWFAVELSRRCRLSLLKVHARASADFGGRAVPGPQFMSVVQRLLTHPAEPLAPRSEVLRETKAKWCELLGLQAGTSRAELRSSDLLQRFRSVFPAVASSWAPPYLAPDLMIAATSADAISRRDARYVVGEIHYGNTIMYPFVRAQCPDAAELERAYARDVGGRPRLMVHFPDDETSPFKMSFRINNEVWLPDDYVLELTALPSGHPRERVVRVADLSFDIEGEVPVIRVPDRGLTFDAVDLILRFVLRGGFTLTPEWDHAPRVTVDDLIASRETWVLPANMIGDHEATTLEQFATIREQLRSRGIPRFCFYMCPGEPKPIYLDLDSPMYVDLFAKTVRGLVTREPEGRIKLSEMVPSLDELWLTDDKGARYTSELRFVCKS